MFLHRHAPVHTCAFRPPQEIANEGDPRNVNPGTFGTGNNVSKDLFDLHRATGEQVLRHRRICAGRDRSGPASWHQSRRVLDVFGRRHLEISPNREPHVVANGNPCARATASVSRIRHGRLAQGQGSPISDGPGRRVRTVTPKIPTALHAFDHRTDRISGAASAGMPASVIRATASATRTDGGASNSPR